MYLLFSHKLTPEQIEDAKKSLKIKEFIYLPKNLQKKWSNVPPELEDLSEYAKEFEEFIKSANKGDYVLIQGDFGLVYKMVSYSKKLSLKPIYATTKRVSKEIKKDGKIIKISEFKHIRFREYR
jgi:hypothetical protein